MTLWTSIILAGLINYLSRFCSILLLNPKKFNKTTKDVLIYVPSAVFPAIIFPTIFLSPDETLVHINDPKVVAISIAFLVGILTNNLIFTILSGLFSFWTLIFLL